MLLVWGSLGKWLVLDGEGHALYQCFTVPVSPAEALAGLARRKGSDPARVWQEGLPLVEAFLARGVLIPYRPEGGLPKPVLEPERPLLSSLTINLTNRCNLACAFCYNRPSPDGKLDPAPFLRWLREGIDAGAVDRFASLFVLGGEPFLEPDRLGALLQGLPREAFREVIVSTNGTLLPAGLPAVFRRRQATLQVSIDVPTPAGHDHRRGEGVFDRARSTVAAFRAEGVEVILSMVLDRSSSAPLADYVSLAREWGVQGVRFIPLRLLGAARMRAPGADGKSDLPNLVARWNELRRLLASAPHTADLLGRDYFSLFRHLASLDHPRTSCGCGSRVLFVDSDGTLTPCPNHRGQIFACGSLADRPLAGLFASSAVLARMRERCTVENLPRCAECWARFWCAGDCRAEATACGDGDPGAPSPYCGQIRQLLPELFWDLGL